MEIDKLLMLVDSLTSDAINETKLGGKIADGNIFAMSAIATGLAAVAIAIRGLADEWSRSLVDD